VNLKKIVFLISVILFLLSTTSAYSLSLFGSKIDGFWVPNMKLSMEFGNMQKNKSLNDPMLGEYFQMIIASIVVFIDGDRCIVFLPGESMEGNITSEGETVTFKLKNTKTAKYYKNEIGKEYLIMADEDEEFSLVLYKKFEI